MAELPKVDAAVRFVSYEPALSPLDRSRVPEGSVHWLICGCESGPNRRRMQLEWALDVKEQCISRGISFFMKQMEVGGKETDKLMDFPIELQTREYPTVASVAPDGVEPGREAE